MKMKLSNERQLWQFEWGDVIRIMTTASFNSIIFDGFSFFFRFDEHFSILRSLSLSCDYNQFSQWLI